MIRWDWHAFAQLPPQTLYAILKLRSDVFVVEQNCVFSDMDDVDQACEHLCGFEKPGLGEARLVAYLRLVPPGVKLPEASIGRVAVARDARRRGLAREAMVRGLARLKQRFPGTPVRIGAQHYMEGFYRSLGFSTTGAPFLEDGIPHVEMVYRG